MRTSQASAEQIVWICPQILPAVLRIEREAFEFPWSAAEFRNRLKRTNCAGMAARRDGRIVGFVIYRFGVHTVDLENLTVSRLYRRNGVGERLVAKLIMRAAVARRKRISSFVRETNLPAQLFFRSCEFTADAVVRGYYSETTEDAYWFARDVDREAVEWAKEKLTHG